MLRLAPLLLLSLAAGYVYEAKDGSAAVEITALEEPGPWTVSHNVGSKVEGAGSASVALCRELCYVTGGDWLVDNVTVRLNGLDLWVELVPGGAPDSVDVTVKYGGKVSTTTLDAPAQVAAGDPALGLLASALAAAHKPGFYVAVAKTLEEAMEAEGGTWPDDVLIAAEAAACFYRYSTCSSDAERGAQLLDLFAAVDPD
ncbi:MAG: hypothetical protein AAF682_03920 [Planctomycetota bacterium]